MSWDRPAASEALAEVLRAALPTVSTFEKPPATFNPPALVVGYPRTVVKHTPTFAVDLASLEVLHAVAVESGDDLDVMLQTSTSAIEADMTLGDAVQLCVVTQWQTWRLLIVSGVEMLVADLALDIRM